MNQTTRLVPQRFHVHQPFRGVDSHLYASRTRFLLDTLLGLFEQRTWLMRAAEPGRAVAGGPETRGDIAARLAVHSGDERQS
jgi:DNA helicase II / ATP-dependent DNA helicase PcrA